MLVTVREGTPPRVHPVNAGIVDGHFYTFAQGKRAKRRELDEDGKIRLPRSLRSQANQDEFLVEGGGAVQVTDKESGRALPRTGSSTSPTHTRSTS